MLEPLDLLSEDKRMSTIRERIGGVTETAPVLYIIDTLARCMVGGDENSAQHMGQVIANAELLRRETERASARASHRRRG